MGNKCEGTHPIFAGSGTVCLVGMFFVKTREEFLALLIAAFVCVMCAAARDEGYKTEPDPGEDSMP